MLPHILAIHLVLRTGRDHLATRHDHEGIGQLAGEVEILLAQQDAISPRWRSRRMTRPMSLMMEGWMPSVGSSRMISLGSPAAPGNGQLLLLAAGQIAAATVQHFLQHREEFIDLALDAGGTAPDSVAMPMSRFSSTVRRAKISRPCGT
jgi:hypothetical protein